MPQTVRRLGRLLRHKINVERRDENSGSAAYIESAGNLSERVVFDSDRRCNTVLFVAVARSMTPLKELPARGLGLG